MSDNENIDIMGGSYWQGGNVKPRKVKTRRSDPVSVPEEFYGKVDVSGDPGQYMKDTIKTNMNLRTRIKMNLSNGKIKRFLTGKNRAGRVFHSVLDVLPVPNVHEVVKRVIKESDQAGRTITAIEILRDTLKRLDWMRTAGAVIVAALLIRASQWTGVDLEIFFNLVRQISDVL